jgi:hypothetical protein
MKVLGPALALTVVVLSPVSAFSQRGMRLQEPIRPKELDAIRLQEADAPLNKVSRSRAIIRAQIELGISHESRALGIMRTATDPDSSAQAIAYVRRGYYQLRFAVSGIRLILESSRQGFRDPLLDLSSQHLDQAMSHVRAALNGVQVVAAGDTRRLPRTLESLQAAIVSATEGADLI